MPKQIARWNSARDVWETETTGLFCEHSDVFSETWPTSGMTRGGTAYALPTWVPLTDVSASSSSPLLPTPTTSEGNGAGDHGTGALDLRTTVAQLLSTPRAADGTKGGPNQRGSSGDLMLPSAVQDWREYEAAIRRQERAFGRPAPAPTEPGRTGKPRLSPKFCEWLMGLPEGHVTGIPGITRNDQLKALGNGVVPQQCAAALRAFLADTAKEHAA